MDGCTIFNMFVILCLFINANTSRSRQTKQLATSHQVSNKSTLTVSRKLQRKHEPRAVWPRRQRMVEHQLFSELFLLTNADSLQKYYLRLTRSYATRIQHSSVPRLKIRHRIRHPLCCWTAITLSTHSTVKSLW